MQKLSRAEVSQLRALRTDKKEREAAQAVIISGVKLVTDLAKVLPISLLVIDAKASFLPSFQVAASRLATKEDLQKMTGLTAPGPCVAKIPVVQRPFPATISRLLVLDGLNDPGNLGTLFRSALALGWEGVFLISPCVDLWNDKAIRAAQGASFLLPFRQGTREEFLSFLKTYQLTPLIADASGQSCDQLIPPRRIALILGNESEGISPHLSGKRIAIAISHLDSLNVASAGAILMHHLRPHGS